MNNKPNYFLLFLCINFFCITLTQINDRKLNILFCVKSFPSYTSWFILNQIREFIQAGHQVTILARDVPHTTANNYHPDVVKYDLLEKTFINYLPKNKQSFDFIFCQFSSLAPYVIKFKEQHNIQGQLFVFVRGAFCYRSPLQKAIRDTIFKEADLLLPVCEFSKNQLIKLGCSNNKIKIVHSTIDSRAFTFKPRVLPKTQIKIVTTSRLTEQKGLEYAIKAMPTVLKLYPNCSYTIIGDGELYTELSQLILDLHLEKNVFLIGWKTPEELRQILYESHVFLHPSVTRQKNGGHEAIPTAIMEAMATGLPIISTYHAGIPELIKEGITGFLVPERNESMLAQKIIFLLQHPEIWETIGLAGRKAIEKDHDSSLENKKFMHLCMTCIKPK